MAGLAAESGPRSLASAVTGTGLGGMLEGLLRRFTPNAIREAARMEERIRFPSLGWTISRVGFSPTALPPDAAGASPEGGGSIARGVGMSSSRGGAGIRSRSPGRRAVRVRQGVRGHVPGASEIGFDHNPPDALRLGGKLGVPRPGNRCAPGRRRPGRRRCRRSGHPDRSAASSCACLHSLSLGVDAVLDRARPRTGLGGDAT